MRTIHLIKAKHPRNGIVEYAKVPSRTNPFVAYFVLKHSTGKVSCNCGDYIFNRPKQGCAHIKLVLGRITKEQYLEK